MESRLDLLLGVLHPGHYLVLRHKKMLLDLMLMEERKEREQNNKQR